MAENLDLAWIPASGIFPITSFNAYLEHLNITVSFRYGHIRSKFKFLAGKHRGHRVWVFATWPKTITDHGHHHKKEGSLYVCQCGECSVGRFLGCYYCGT